MDNSRQDTQTYLLTLASRLDNTKAVVVLVEESDGRHTHHRVLFEENHSWINIIGHLHALAYDIMATFVRWNGCNPDGSKIDEAQQ